MTATQRFTSPNAVTTAATIQRAGRAGQLAAGHEVRAAATPLLAGDARDHRGGDRVERGAARAGDEETGDERDVARRHAEPGDRERGDDRREDDEQPRIGPVGPVAEERLRDALRQRRIVARPPATPRVIACLSISSGRIGPRNDG